MESDCRHISTVGATDGNEKRCSLGKFETGETDSPICNRDCPGYKVGHK